ncbi:MAG: adenylyl-sulfate kinase [Rhodospirillaceae bacterium]
MSDTGSTKSPRRAPKSQNITRVAHRVTTDEREQRNGHRGGILWFTGLSASGKSTLATHLEEILHKADMQVFVLDGDNVRHGLCADLGFSPADRTENIRRIGELAQIMAGAGIVVITAFISPYRADRDSIRTRADGVFHEIHIAAPIDVCERRDPKGLYGKAHAGELAEFTGVSAPYEAPVNPELVINTDALDVDACVGMLADYAKKAFAL